MEGKYMTEQTQPTDANMEEENFTPQYLQALRISRNSCLDAEEVERVKHIVLQANSENKQTVEISFLTSTNWRKINEYFRGLGFWVGSSGYIQKQHNENGDEVFWFIYSWYVGNEGDN
jgi:hypothetical protein